MRFLFFRTRPPSLAIVLILSLVFGLSVSAARADTIHLKDGRAVHGVVDLANSDEARVRIRTSSGPLTIPRLKIERIEQQANMSRADPSRPMISSMSATIWIVWIGTRNLLPPSCLPRLSPRPERFISRLCTA